MFNVSDRSLLISAADNVFSQVCAMQMGKMIRSPRHEIDFIASFIENGVGLLQAAWASILAPSIQVRVYGLFCHQSPYVVLNGAPPFPVTSRRCELADLLIVHSHRSAVDTIHWRASLIQSKIDSGTWSVPMDTQFWLYSRWPRFQITAPRFCGRVRNFFPWRVDSGAYAAVSPAGWRFFPFGRSAPGMFRPPVSGGEFVVGMLYGLDPAQSGRSPVFGRIVHLRPHDDWSETIWDLLNITGMRSFRLMGSRNRLYSSTMPALSCFLTGPIDIRGQYSWMSGRLPPSEREPFDASGISVLYIETDASSEGAGELI